MRFGGLTWRSSAEPEPKGAFILATGDRDRKAALARMRSLTERDSADGWEADGPDLFRQ